MVGNGEPLLNEQPAGFQLATINSIQAQIDEYQRGRCTESDAISAVSELVWVEGTAAGIDGAFLRPALKSHVENIRNITKDLERHTAQDPGRVRSPFREREDEHQSRSGSRQRSREPSANPDGPNADNPRHEDDRRDVRARKL